LWMTSLPLPPRLEWCISHLQLLSHLDLTFDAMHTSMIDDLMGAQNRRRPEYNPATDEIKILADQSFAK
jgi:hypothetical protein